VEVGRGQGAVASGRWQGARRSDLVAPWRDDGRAGKGAAVQGGAPCALGRQRLDGTLLPTGHLGARLLGAGSREREVQCKCSADGGLAARGYGLAGRMRPTGWPEGWGLTKSERRQRMRFEGIRVWAFS
jgi:hypothetical protein